MNIRSLRTGGHPLQLTGFLASYDAKDKEGVVLKKGCGKPTLHGFCVCDNNMKHL